MNFPNYITVNHMIFLSELNNKGVDRNNFSTMLQSEFKNLSGETAENIVSFYLENYL